MKIWQVLALMVGGWFLIDFLFGLTLMIRDRLRHRKALKAVIPQMADPNKLCRGPHSWILARTITAEGPGTVQVCRACGFISGSNKVASPESIDRIEENNRIREIESRLLKDFLAREDDDMKKYFDLEIKSGLDFNKLAHIHSAGMTFGQRFSLYKAARSEEIEKELTKSNA